MRRFIALVVLALLGLPAGASAGTLGEQRVLLTSSPPASGVGGCSSGGGEGSSAGAVSPHTRCSSTGRHIGRVPAARTVANLLVVTDDRLAVRVGRGRRRVQVIAVDRAGNRSTPVRRIVGP